MKKLLLLVVCVFFTYTTFGQPPKMGFQSSNENIYGTWSSWDGGSILYMNYGETDTFVRISHTLRSRLNAHIQCSHLSVREG